jgi:hypothetical protein
MPPPPVHPSSAHHWVQTLRAKGLRATAQRAAVPDFLHHHPHTDAEATFQAARYSLPTISLQAVPLIVQDLSRKGLGRRISLSDSASARTKRAFKTIAIASGAFNARDQQGAWPTRQSAFSMRPAKRRACALSKPASFFAAFAMIVTPQTNEREKSRDK